MVDRNHCNQAASVDLASQSRLSRGWLVLVPGRWRSGDRLRAVVQRLGTAHRLACRMIVNSSGPTR